MTQKSWRRAGVAGAALLALTFGAIAPTAASAAENPTDPNLLLHYDFSTPGSVTDVSGNGRNATIVGTGATVANGVLTLPGGASNSGAGYVRLPAGTFDGHDTLTISTWLRNDTGAGNYAAMFFGTEGGSYPAQYWLLNPRNPQSRFKTVVTNGNTPSSPWSTEYGISPTNASQGFAGPTTGTDWGMYTTVITPTSITGYYNGVSVGTVATNRTVSQFGSGLVGFIGRSTYSDPFFKGSVDDVIVSASAYSPTEIANLYHGNDRVSPAQTIAALTADADAISLPGSTVSNLALPEAGSNLSRITWASSQPEALTASGVVTRPVAGSPDAVVTLTATLTLAGETITRTYQVTVPAIDRQRDLDRDADAFRLGITVTASDITLAPTSGTMALTWSSSNPQVVSATGTITRAATDATADLTATFTRDGLTTTRTYPLTVKAQSAGQIVSYVRSGNTTKTEVLHLAAGATGSPLVAMNNNKGVLYPTFGTGTSQFANPTIFRHPDGTFGVIASNNATNGQIFVYRSADLVTFTDGKLVTTNTQGIVVSRADARFDNGTGVYRVTLRTAAGTAFETTTKDFQTFTPATPVTASAVPTVSGLPTGAIEASSFAVTAAELAHVQQKLGRITNTSIDAGDDVTIEAGQTLTLPEKAQLGYSDGSTKQLGITWDTSGVDPTKAGTYTVTGTVDQPVYGDAKGILVPERADPWVLRDDNAEGETTYYFTGSYPTTQGNPGVGYDRIVLRSSDTINGLTTAREEVLLWARNAASPNTSNGSKVATGAYRYFWAPELHKINGDWYILFTSSRGGSVWDIRPAIMRAPGNSDPMVASNWEELGYIKTAPGDTAAFTSFSLDMTYFEANGKHYMVWAEKPGSSDLRMAEIDPADPTQLTTTSILLSTPNYAWERTNSQVINEGAAVIKSESEVFVFFSASEVNETYSVGMLRAPIEGDLMNPATWVKTGYPLLTSEDFGNQQNGPGHNSFTLDADGNPVIVYHARPPISEWIAGADGGLNDPSRHARVKTVHFAADGSAVLNQSREEELAPGNRTVSLTVTVTAPEPQLTVAASVTTRCVAGKLTYVVTLKNSSEVPVAFTTSAAFGSKTLTVKAGTSTSVTHATRDGSAASGTLTYQATATVAGAPVSVTDAVAYGAATCR